jgi:GNAT superfamily N-acetyltransferase
MAAKVNLRVSKETRDLIDVAAAVVRENPHRVHSGQRAPACDRYRARSASLHPRPRTARCVHAGSAEPRCQTLNWGAYCSTVRRGSDRPIRRRAYGPHDRTHVRGLSRASRCGLHALATRAESCGGTPGKPRRNSLDALPLIILPLLAVDSPFQGQGIGRGFLKDALRRALQASEIVGIRAVLVHAIDDMARTFYERHGFVAFPTGARTLYPPLETLRRAL